MTFDALGLAPELLRALSEEGYAAPTPIQQKAIPEVLAGRDVLAAAQTGTGKTAAFTLPLLQRLSTQPANDRRARVLVLTPTRELAAQIGDNLKTYGRHLRLRHTVVFGGVGHTPQADAMRKGVDIIVACPGRLLDHLQQRTADLSGIQHLVLDEADRMLDMGFIHDIKKVLAALPRQRQSLLFSATFSPDIRKLAESFLKDPVSVEVAPRNTTAERIQQRLIPVDKARKVALIAHLVRENDWQQVLVFTTMKHMCNRIAEQLTRMGVNAAAIHGNKSQSARTKALADFKSGALRVLVATDIAARGLDIEELPHVINHELPKVPEDYVHRIGRTGRAGASGEALSLLSPDQRDEWKAIARVIKRELPQAPVAGFEPGSAPSAQEQALRTQLADTEDQGPPPRGRGRGHGGGGGGGAQRASAPKGNDGRGNSPAAPRGAQPQGRGQGRGGPQAAAGKPAPERRNFDDRRPSGGRPNKPNGSRPQGRGANAPSGRR